MQQSRLKKKGAAIGCTGIRTFEYAVHRRKSSGNGHLAGGFSAVFLMLNFLGSCSFRQAVFRNTYGAIAEDAAFEGVQELRTNKKQPSKRTDRAWFRQARKNVHMIPAPCHVDTI